MIDLHVAKSLAMSYAVEDFFGPYELLWGLNTHYPEAAPKAKQFAATKALGYLIGRGLIEVHACGTGPPCEAPISESQAFAALSSPSFWLVPDEVEQTPYYWLAASAAGERAYYHGGEFESL